MPLLHFFPSWQNGWVVSLTQILTSTWLVLLSLPSTASTSAENIHFTPSGSVLIGSGAEIWKLTMLNLKTKFGDTSSTSCCCWLSSSARFSSELSLLFPRTHSWPFPLVTSVEASVNSQGSWSHFMPPKIYWEGSFFLTGTNLPFFTQQDLCFLLIFFKTKECSFEGYIHGKYIRKIKGMVISEGGGRLN